MIDPNIKRFCELICQINALNEFLDREKESFYDGGHSFEECYSSQIDELVDLQQEFRFLFRSLLHWPYASCIDSGPDFDILQPLKWLDSTFKPKQPPKWSYI